MRAPVYCAMGDSIALGIGIPEGEPTWVERVARAFPRLRVVNMGVGGENTDHALLRLPALRLEAPDIASFQYGMNDHCLLPDGRPQVPLDRFEENLDRMVCEASGARVILITNHRIIEGDETKYYHRRHPRDRSLQSANEWIERYNERTRAVARRHGCRLIDMAVLCRAYPLEEFLRSLANSDFDDGVHPHALGSRVYGEAVCRAIREIANEEGMEL